MKTIALVIARGGSKGIPRKNLQMIGGIPLVAFKILSALNSEFMSRVILSTEDPEIREVGLHYGAEVPFIRPADLASDIASSDAVALHAMNWIEENEGRKYDRLLLLEPATPFALPSDYLQASMLMTKTCASVVVGMVEHKIDNVFIGEIAADNSISAIVQQIMALPRVDRQSRPKKYTMNGAFYLMDWDSFKVTKSRYRDPTQTYGIIMDESRSVEIDNQKDLDWARYLVGKGVIDIKYWTNLVEKGKNHE